MTPKVGKQDWLEEAKLTIRTPMNRAKDSYGFVSYRKNREAIQGAIKVMDQITKALRTNEAEKVIELSLLVISAMAILRRHNDDSDGDTGSLIYQTNESMRQLIPSLNQDESRTFVKRLCKEATMKKYDDSSDVRSDFFNLAAEAITDELSALPLLKVLPSYMQKDPINQYNSDYIYATLAYLKVLKMLKRFEELNDLMNKNMSHHKIAMFAFEFAMEKKDYEEAFRLAEKGSAQERHSYHLKDWQNAQLLALKALNRFYDYKTLLVQMANQGNIEAYQLLKKACLKIEWDKLKPQILDQWIVLNPFQVAHQELFIEEEDWSRLIISIERHPSTIKTSFLQLVKVEPQKAKSLFSSFILSAAQVAKARPDYRGIASLIRKYAKGTDKASAEMVIRTLIHLYPKRPAFIEELRMIRLK